MTRGPTASRELPALAACALGASLAVLLCYALLAPSRDFLGAVCEWDCGWYAQIAESGYWFDPNSTTYAPWAFFPLFPLSAHLFGLLSGLPQPAAGIVLDNSLVPVLACLSVCYGRRFRGIRHPRFAVLAFVLFPYGIYLRSGYSEAVYGLCLMAALFLVRARRPGWATIPLFLLSAARPTGLLMGLILAGSVLARAEPGRGGRAGRLIEAAALLAAATGGLSLYMIFLHRLTGDALAFAHVEAAWGRSVGDPVSRFVAAFGSFDLNHFHSRSRISQNYVASVGLLGLLMIAGMAVRGWRVEAAMLFGTVLMASSTSLDALPRFVFCNPLGILFVAALVERLAPPLRSFAAAGLLALQLLFVVLWYDQAAFLI